MNLAYRGLCAATLLLALAAAPAAHAQTFYTTNTTITTAVSGDAVIGLSSTGAAFSPAVTLAPTGSIGHDVRVYNGSTFVMNGNVGGSLSAYDSSAITVANGTLAYALFGDNNSTVNITGGTFNNALEAFNNSTFNVSGGTFSNLFGYDSSTINLIGSVTATLTNASFGYLGAYSQYTLAGSFTNGTVAPGTFVNLVNGSGAKLNINGASVTGGPGFTPVPEPGSVALFAGLSITGVGFVARRRRARA